MAKKIEEQIERDAPATTTEAPAPEVTPASAPPGWRAKRILKRTGLPLMRGDDVKAVQRALIARGYACGADSVEGAFGKDTERAVRAFQGSARLPVNGIAGRKTVEALGGVFGE
jgi:peptidoglycan hydrolase-like protein with peptidoglycan-binding domain